MGAKPDHANGRGIPPFWHILKDIRQPSSLTWLRAMLPYMQIASIPHQYTGHTLADYALLALRVGHRLITEDNIISEQNAGRVRREREAINRRAYDMIFLIIPPKPLHPLFLHILNGIVGPENLDHCITGMYDNPDYWGSSQDFNAIASIIGEPIGSGYAPSLGEYLTGMDSTYNHYRCCR